MKKKILIYSNWKAWGSYKLIKNYISLLNEVNIPYIKEIVIFAPYIYMDLISKELKNKSVKLGSQNVSNFNSYPHTGSISIKMLKDFKCSYVLLGHSECREDFGESNKIIREKLEKLLINGMKVVLCIGEDLNMYNKFEKVIKFQISSIFKKSKLNLSNFQKNIVIAYEPLWAIGKGKPASIEYIKKVSNFIKNELQKYFTISIPIIYGGSINLNNYKDIFYSNYVNGGLIGSFSTKINDFIKIIL